MKHKYLAKRYWEVKLPPLSKTNEMAKRYPDVIDLSVGDPDYPVDKKVIDDMYKDALAGHTKYTAFLGDEEFREEICKWYRDDFGCNYGIENVMVTAGGTHAMYLVMESILDEGDEIIVISPYYTYYEPQILLPRGRVVVYDTLAEDNFEIDLERFEKKISSRTKAVIVNSPNNPTGRVYKEETIKGLIELANKYDFLIIADDIYRTFNYTDRQKPICAFDPDNPRILTVYSFSKDFAMTGFRLGYIIGEKSIIECIRNVNEAVNFTINAMAQRAGIYAIRRRKEIQKEIHEEYRKRVFYAYERIQNFKNIKCSKPEGTFYLFADIRDTGLSSEEIWEKILDDAHVLVLPGIGFGQAGEGYIRIACTSDVEVLKEAFDRMEGVDIFK
ncbi:MAG: aminotransferase class I/II-fold pyridoxal phosphate-dependent enzyme [Tissierellia bacterium]|nr:aminotransferase class I/II-fold pyridoxal phosphate-dependent enzyme [Tissierellia bacterium]